MQYSKCLVLNKKLQSLQSKVWCIYQKQNKTKNPHNTHTNHLDENCTGRNSDIGLLDLLDKYFKSSILNMLKEVKETVEREKVKEIRKITYEQIGDRNKIIEIIRKKTSKNSEVEKQSS